MASKMTGQAKYDSWQLGNVARDVSLKICFVARCDLPVGIINQEPNICMCALSS